MPRRLCVIVVAVAVITCAASPAAAANVLVYGPAGTTVATQYMPQWGYSVTIVDQTSWEALSTSDFGSYDALYVGGSDAGITDWSAPLKATAAVWGPAVTGNVYLSTGDPDFHIFSAGPQRIVENSLYWAAANGATEFGGKTGLVFFTGVLELNPGVDVLGDVALAPTLGTLTTVFSNTEAISIFPAATAHPATFIPNLLTAADFVWGNFCHGALLLGSSPGDYTEVAECADGNVGVIVRSQPPTATAAGEPPVPRTWGHVKATYR